jgi:serine/threonine-protein kinase RsbW
VNGEYTAQGFAVPDSLETLHQLLADVATAHPDVSAVDIAMMETAVIEIAGNLIEHGRPPGQVRYRLTLRVHPDRLEVLLCDSGERLAGSLDPLELPDALAEGGRGLFLANAVLHSLVYARTPEANSWTLVRLRATD